MGPHFSFDNSRFNERRASSLFVVSSNACLGCIAHCSVLMRSACKIVLTVETIVPNNLQEENELLTYIHIQCSCDVYPPPSWLSSLFDFGYASSGCQQYHQRGRLVAGGLVGFSRFSRSQYLPGRGFKTSLENAFLHFFF